MKKENGGASGGKFKSGTIDRSSQSQSQSGVGARGRSYQYSNRRADKDEIALRSHLEGFLEFLLVFEGFKNKSVEGAEISIDRGVSSSSSSSSSSLTKEGGVRFEEQASRGGVVGAGMGNMGNKTQMRSSLFVRDTNITSAINSSSREKDSGAQNLSLATKAASDALERLRKENVAHSLQQQKLMMSIMSTNSPEWDLKESLDLMLKLIRDFFVADRVGIFVIDKVRATMMLYMSQFDQNGREMPKNKDPAADNDEGKDKDKNKEKEKDWDKNKSNSSSGISNKTPFSGHGPSGGSFSTSSAISQDEDNSKRTQEQEEKEKVAQTETGTNAIEVPLAGIAGHVARTSELLNFQDVYESSMFDSRMDQKTNYRTRQMLCIPCLDKSVGGTCVAVLQIINPRQSQAAMEVDKSLNTGTGLNNNNNNNNSNNNSNNNNRNGSMKSYRTTKTSKTKKTNKTTRAQRNLGPASGLDTRNFTKNDEMLASLISAQIGALLANHPNPISRGRVGLESELSKSAANADSVIQSSTLRKPFGVRITSLSFLLADPLAEQVPAAAATGAAATGAAATGAATASGATGGKHGDSNKHTHEVKVKLSAAGAKALNSSQLFPPSVKCAASIFNGSQQIGLTKIINKVGLTRLSLPGPGPGPGEEKEKEKKEKDSASASASIGGIGVSDARRQDHTVGESHVWEINQTLEFPEVWVRNLPLGSRLVLQVSLCLCLCLVYVYVYVYV